MLPIRDDNPTQRTAWITMAIIALNVVAFPKTLPMAILGEISCLLAAITALPAAVKWWTSRWVKAG